MSNKSIQKVGPTGAGASKPKASSAPGCQSPPSIQDFERACDIAGVALWRWDPATNIAWANAATQRLFGLDQPAGFFSAEHFLARVHPEDLPDLRLALEQHASGKTEVFRCSFRVNHPDGVLWLRGRGHAEARDASGRATAIVGATVDVTSEVNALQESARANWRLDSLSENVADMVFELVRSSVGDYTLTFVNDGVSDLFGVPKGSAKQDFLNLLEVIQPRYHLRVMSDLALSAETLSPWHSVFVIDHPRRGPVWAEGHAIPSCIDNGQVHWHGSIRDITERKAMEEELSVSARLDPLTGLANRSLFVDRLNDAIRRAKSNRAHHFAVLFIDVDSFKTVNDSFGHAAGDELLAQMSKRLTRHVRSDSSTRRHTDNDTAARLGGDEFIVLLQNMSAQTAERVAKRLLDALSKPYRLSCATILPTVGIGIVLSDSRYDEADAVLRDVDIAMFAAKASGRGCFRVFDSTLRASALRRMGLENDLKKAVTNGEMHLVFQPIVSLKTGALEWVEALLRWNHPVYGPVSPVEFIPIAEETGSIVSIGDWVLDKACEQVAFWRDTLGEKMAPGISVNLSRHQLEDLHLVKRIGKSLDRHAVPAETIHFEITESTVMRDPATAQIILTELRSHGHRLSLDDFGTGYSSLSSLHQFPLDYLKIDKSFVHNLSVGDDYVILVRAITRLAAVLDIKVVIEGIETEEQLAKLRPAGCDLGQGYLFGKPMTGEDICAYVREIRSVRKPA